MLLGVLIFGYPLFAWFWLWVGLRCAVLIYDVMENDWG